MPTGLAQNLSFILLGEDKTASKTMTGAQATAEKVTGRIGSAFQKVGGVIGGEFGGVLDEVGTGIQELGAKGAKLSTSMQAIGAITATAGVALVALGSNEALAQKQLQAAVKTTGESWDTYKEQIEDAIHEQENYDHSSIDTQTALRTLVGATGSTATALKNMSLVSDLAAAKHETLAKAATDVSKILNGTSTKTLTSYGITMEKAYDNTKDLAAAQIALQKATQNVTSAEAKLKEIEAIDASKKKLSIAQQYSLAAAHKKVSDAEAIVATATQKLNDLQGTSISKTKAGSDAVTQLSAKLKGQASASVDSFGAQVDIVKTKVTDWIEQISGPAGTALSTLGTVVGIAGTAIDLYGARQEALAAKELAASVGATAVGAASAAAVPEVADLAVATVGLDAAMDANPIGLVAAAVGVLGTVITGGIIASQRNLTAATADYTSELERSNGVIDDNIRAMTAKALTDSGALGNAAKLGISGKLVVAAVLDEKGARTQLNAEITKSSAAYIADIAAGKPLTKAQEDQARATSDLRTDVGSLGVQFKTQVKNANLYRDAIHGVGTDSNAATSALSKLYAKIKAAPAGKGSSGASADVHLYLSQPGNTPTHAIGGRIGPGETSSIVGEDGPEVVHLPSGSQVFPNSSKRMSDSGGAVVVHLTVQGSVHSERSLQKAIQDAFVNGIPSGNISKSVIKTALGV